MGDWEPSEKLAVLYSFDTYTLTEISSELNIRLEIPVLDWTAPGLNAPTVGVFTFDFSLPVNPGQVIDVGQTIETTGVSITLDEISISPWETKAIFRFNPPYDENVPIPIASMTLPDGKSANESYSQNMVTAYQIGFMGDFTEKQGEWTIVISELIFPPDMSQATPVPGNPGVFYGNSSDTERLEGPWTFRFQVP
ncbi:MAG: hypothetical protein PHU23_12400, partial [Dehalococcoidales bacterium]|nr:hypothetical protein [Dehalococcoidales bacterium]